MQSGGMPIYNELHHGKRSYLYSHIDKICIWLASVLCSLATEDGEDNCVK